MAVLLGLAVLLTEPDQPTLSEGPHAISPATWGVLAVQVVIAVWTCLAKARVSPKPPLAWRVSFRFGGLVLILAACLVALAFESLSFYGKDFAVLLALVTASGALQFVTLARLLSVWSRLPALRRELGVYVVQLSVYWTVVVMLLGAVLLWTIADEFLTSALLAASVLALPLAISILWSVGQSLSDLPNPTGNPVSGCTAPATSRTPVPSAPWVQWVFVLLGFIIARRLTVRATGRSASTARERRSVRASLQSRRRRADR